MNGNIENCRERRKNPTSGWHYPERSQSCFTNGGASVVTHIGDRESDFYEELATVPDKHNHVLVRVCQDRRLLEKSQSLYAYLREQPSQGTYTINIPSDPRIGRIAREALLNVRCTTVQLQRPAQLKVQDYPPSITMNAVEAEEINPPFGQEAIHWRLLTTHQVVCLEQALQVIKWYRWRWRIEQLFATLKKAGLNLEATQLESVTAIQRLTILALGVAVRTLQLLEGRDNCDLPASVAFSVDQQQCLSQLAETLEGYTQKQQNPYPPACLPWAVWLIARLGGWSGYVSGRPPGMPTLVHGLRQFEAMFLGWKLAHNQLVCTR